MVPEEVKQEILDDVYMPTYDDKKKKFVYKRDPKRLKFAQCKTCGIRIYHENAVSVVKCNTCGYTRPTTKLKFIHKKEKCQICGRKRVCTQYINEKEEVKRLCKKCAGVTKK